jgi:pyridoxal phosphate enzyme (YggS family)
MRDFHSEELFRGVTVVAVSKTFPALDVRRVWQEGFRHFGENRVQEFVEKHKELSDLPLCWHFIGHLQTNKVSRLLGKVSLLHSLDNLRLYDKICTEGRKQGLSMPALLQVNISAEQEKSGFSPSELEAAISCIVSRASEFCPIKGLMCIGSDPGLYGLEKTRQEYVEMRCLFDYFQKGVLEGKYGSRPDLFNMEHLSMGMSGDYEQAIECGSNMVRIGSLIFGKRSRHGQ